MPEGAATTLPSVTVLSNAKSYVGRAAGFSRAELITASHGGGSFVGRTDSGGGDDISIDVGIDLYEQFGSDMTEMDLHRAMVGTVPKWQGVQGDGERDYKIIP